MKKQNFFLILILTFIMACKSDNIKDERIKLAIHPSLDEIHFNDERLELIPFLEDYLNLMFDSTVSHRNSFWQSNLLYGRFDHFLRMDQAKEYLIEHPPQLLGIRKDEAGRYRPKLCFRRGDFPEKIIELILAKDALGKFYFYEGIGEKVKEFELRKKNDISFYYSPASRIDSAAEEKVINYNGQLAAYFNQAERNLRVIVCADLKDYARLQSTDYNAYLNLDRQTGGRALPDEDLYISANGSPYYPHELVHIYTAQFKPNPFFDEGLATFLGGSGGKALQDHLSILATKRDQFDFSKLNEHKCLYDNYTAPYLIGGMLMKLANDDYGGKESVFKLLSCGRTDEDLYAAIEEVFGKGRDELDAFIKDELSKYDNDKRLSELKPEQ